MMDKTKKKFHSKFFALDGSSDGFPDDLQRAFEWDDMRAFGWDGMLAFEWDDVKDQKCFQVCCWELRRKAWRC